jgi:hypothetical protein
MRIFKFLFVSLPLTCLAMQSYAQVQKIQDDEKRKIWVKANLATKEDAIDFIKTAYQDFTIIIPKKSVESGVYRRELKFSACELTIETDSRQQESAWKSDREFVKDIVVIDFDRVILEGNDIKPSSPENSKGLFAGHSYAHFHKIPVFSILAPAPNRDGDKFTDKHYEEHLQWAYQYLIDECTGKGK